MLLTARDKLVEDLASLSNEELTSLIMDAQTEKVRRVVEKAKEDIKIVKKMLVELENVGVDIYYVNEEGEEIFVNADELRFLY